MSACGRSSTRIVSRNSALSISERSMDGPLAVELQARNGHNPAVSWCVVCFVRNLGPVASPLTQVCGGAFFAGEDACDQVRDHGGERALPASWSQCR